MRTQKSIFFSGALLLGLSGALGGGCASRPAPMNPLITGHMPTSKKFSPSGRQDAARGLPAGTLAGEATLASLDDNEVCFEAILRTTGDREDLTNPQGWRVILKGENPDFETQDFSVRALRAIEPTHFDTRGNKLLGLAAQACQLAGHCSDEQVQKATWGGDKAVVLTGGGIVCFENRGRIRPSTEHVALRFDDMRSNWGSRSRYDFRWDFR